LSLPENLQDWTPKMHKMSCQGRGPPRETDGALFTVRRETKDA